MRRPMIPLTFSVAIFDKLTRRTCLETDNPLHLLLAAISAAVGRRIVIETVHVMWVRQHYVHVLFCAHHERIGNTPR
jgi:hypothetical protein